MPKIHNRFEDKLKITPERFKESNITCKVMERHTWTGDKFQDCKTWKDADGNIHHAPTKDTIRKMVHKPDPTNLQICYANVLLPHMIGYAVGYANVLRCCDFLLTPMWEDVRRGKVKFEDAMFNRDRQKCYWCLDNADRCSHNPYQIVDSGMFSLIAGAKAKKGGFTKEKFDLWQKCYEFYIDHAFQPGEELYTDNKPWFVELDAQAIIGVEETKKVREQLFKNHPDTKFMVVWHPQDGLKGLDEMCEKYDYIGIGCNGKAITDREGQKYKVKIAHYARSRNDKVKIHVLGLQQEDCLRALNGVATTCDCSAWNGPLRFGINALMRPSAKMFGMNDKQLREYEKWVCKESGALELIRAYMPKLFPLCGSGHYTAEDAGWTYEKCQMGAWLMLSAFEHHNYFSALCGPQTLFVKEDGVTPDAMFYEGMRKIMNWEKVTDADMKPGPYEIHDFWWKKTMPDGTLSEDRLNTGPLEYQHIKPQRFL